MNEEILKDILVELLTDKYTKKQKIDALAWGEKNTEVYWRLMKEYQPKYYVESPMFPDCPIQSFTLIKDLNLNN